MKNSVNFWVFSAIGAAVMLVFALILGGCVTKQYTHEDFESETSQEIYRAATDLVASRPRITAGELMQNLGNKFPGIKVLPFVGIQIDLIQFLYEKRQFLMKCTMGEGETIGQGVTAAGPNTIVTSIESVIERKTTELQPD